MPEGFYQLSRERLVYVKDGTVSMEEFGAFCSLALMINPHNGSWYGNFSIFADELNIAPDRARYVLAKLNSLKWIYFQISQGQKKCYFFVIGFPMVTPRGTPPRIVTSEYINQIVNNSEVESHFSKSKGLQCIAETTGEEAHGSEVPYKEKEIEKEKEIYSHPLFQNITAQRWAALESLYESVWLKGRLVDYPNRFSRPFSFDRLKGFLDEDWQTAKPANDFKRENEEAAEKRRAWAAEQKADEGKPIPKELEEWRKKSNAPEGEPRER